MSAATPTNRSESKPGPCANWIKCSGPVRCHWHHRRHPRRPYLATGGLRLPRVPIALLAAVLAGLLTGCGAHDSTGARPVTLGKYGDFGTETITVQTGAANLRTCKADADGFATQAHSLVRRYGDSGSSIDVYYEGLREELADFDARRCGAAVLGSALIEQLTGRQRRLLVAELAQPMAGRVRTALAAS
jgi:hypothetical protein